MSYETLRKNIATHFAANFTALSSDRIIYGDNRPGLNINDGNWVRVSFTILDSNNAQVGTDFQRNDGLITVQIFTPARKGEKAALELVDAVKAVFENKAFNGIKCYTCYPAAVMSEGDQYQINAKTKFEYDIFT